MLLMNLPLLAATPSISFIANDNRIKIFVAIAITESGGKPFVVGKHGELGIVQIKPIVVKDINMKLGKNYSINDCFVPVRAYQIFRDYCRLYKANNLQDVCYLWNGGANWRKRAHTHDQLKNYYKKVQKNIIFVQNLEKFNDMRSDEERKLQIKCVAWFKIRYYKHHELLHHSPNGGSRNIVEATMFKKMGTRPGFPDLFLAVPKNGYHGLFIELKTGNGRLNTNQKTMLKRLEQNGYKVSIVRSFEEFVITINDYMYEKA